MKWWIFLIIFSISIQHTLSVSIGTLNPIQLDDIELLFEDIKFSMVPTDSELASALKTNEHSFGITTVNTQDKYNSVVLDYTTTDALILPFFSQKVEVYMSIPSDISTDSQIKMNLSVLADIMIGDVTHFDDPQIKALNPNVFSFPHEEIRVIFSSEDSVSSQVIASLNHFKQQTTTDFDREFTVFEDIASFLELEMNCRLDYVICIGFESDFGIPVSLVTESNVDREYTMDDTTTSLLENCAFEGVCSINGWENGEWPFQLRHAAVVPKFYGVCEDKVKAVRFLSHAIFYFATLNEFSVDKKRIGLTLSGANKMLKEISEEVACLGSSTMMVPVIDAFSELKFGVLENGGTEKTLLPTMFNGLTSGYIENSSSTTIGTPDQIEAQLLNGELDMSISTVLLNDYPMTSPRIVNIPVASINIGILANVPGVTKKIADDTDADISISLSKETLNLLLYGCLQYWDSEKIVQENPNVAFPHLEIKLFAIERWTHYNVIRKMFFSELSPSPCPFPTIPFSERIKVSSKKAVQALGLIEGALLTIPSNDFESKVEGDIRMIGLRKGNLEVFPEDSLISKESCFFATELDWLDKGCWPLTGVVNLSFLGYRLSPETTFLPVEDIFSGARFDTHCSMVNEFVVRVFNKLDDEASFFTNLNTLHYRSLTKNLIENSRMITERMTCDDLSPLNIHSTHDDSFNHLYVAVPTILILLILLWAHFHVRHHRYRLKENTSLSKKAEENQIRLAESRRIMGWVSHEVRNVLNGVLGLSMFARDALNTGLKEKNSKHLRALVSDASKDINTVVQSCELLSIIVNDSMKLRQLEEGKLKSVNTPTNFFKLIHTVLKVFRPKFNEKKDVVIKLRLFRKAKFALYMADAAHIVQVLSNFISNAIKFTDRGSITIALMRQREKGNIRLEVHDTGIGIDKNTQKNLFKDAFIQAETDQKHVGSGFGLYLCRGLVKNVMHGDIGFKSIEGVGSEFWIEVPVIPSHSYNKNLSDRYNAETGDSDVAENPTEEFKTQDSSEFVVSTENLSARSSSLNLSTNSPTNNKNNNSDNNNPKEKKKKNDKKSDKHKRRSLIDGVIRSSKVTVLNYGQRTKSGSHHQRSRPRTYSDTSKFESPAATAHKMLNSSRNRNNYNGSNTSDSELNLTRSSVRSLHQLNTDIASRKADSLINLFGGSSQNEESYFDGKEDISHTSESFEEIQFSNTLPDSVTTALKKQRINLPKLRRPGHKLSDSPINSIGTHFHSPSMSFKNLSTIGKSLAGTVILICDDSPINRMLLQRALSKEGAKILQASNGLEAINIWKETPCVDLIWMDICMPVMDGNTATKNLRDLDCVCPIIACTGNVQEQDTAICYESGITQIEPKPISPQRSVEVTKIFIDKFKEEKS